MIYQPSDDTFLLAEELKKISKNKKVLDIGTGSGYLSFVALKFGAQKVLASDISEEVVSQKFPFKILKSDLFSSIPKQKFDIIVFNPPYLPKDTREPKDSSLATTGGKCGDEILLRFLSQSPQFLSKNGKILILLSSLTPKKRILSLLKELRYSKKILSSKKIFFETLEVWQISFVS